MADHKRLSGTKISSRKVRAVLGLGMIVGFAQLSTLASWTDSATVASANFQTGTLDLKVGEKVADGAPGQGGVWTHTALGLDNLTPGESVAKLVTVRNDGSIPLKYTGKVSTTTAELFEAKLGLQVTIKMGSSAANNSGSLLQLDRAGSCVGGSNTEIVDTSVSQAAAQFHKTTAISLPIGSTTTYCVLVKLPSSAPNTMQGSSTKLNIVFDAVQPNA